MPCNSCGSINQGKYLGKGFALDIPAGYGSQESEARIADA